MATTYEPIATTTLGSAASSITFSSIPSTYTDLRLVLVCTTSVTTNATWRFNSDSGSNYSYTVISGNGTAASSSSNTNSTAAYFTAAGNTSTTIPHMYTLDVFSYGGSTNKTSLVTESSDDNGSGKVASSVHLWRSTSAITSINIIISSGTYSTGTTATLYGIKAA